MPTKPCLPCRSWSGNSTPRHTCRPVPGTADPRLSGHACDPWPFTTASRIVTPCLRHLGVPFLAYLACLSRPNLVQPSLPRLPLLSCPCPRSLAGHANSVHCAQALPTVPCLPTRANSVLSSPRHACAAVLCIARPRLASRANGFHPRPRLAGHNWPGRALQNHAGHSGPT